MPQGLARLRPTQVKLTFLSSKARITQQALLQELKAGGIHTLYQAGFGLTSQGQCHSRIYKQILIGHRAAVSPWRQDTINPTGHPQCFKAISQLGTKKEAGPQKRKTWQPIPGWLLKVTFWVYCWQKGREEKLFRTEYTVCSQGLGVLLIPRLCYF